MTLAGCFGGDEPEPTPKPTKATSLPMSDVRPAKAFKVRSGGTLRLGVTSFPAMFNPVHVDGVDSTAPQILAPTLGSPVRVTDDGSWKLDRDYATSIEVVDSKPFTVRVELNERAVWQGGTPITSADMVAYVAAMQDDDFAAAGPAVLDDVEQVRPDGRFAYEVVFGGPTADWPAAVYPTLPKAYTRSAETFNTAMATKAPSSNGPFVVSSIERRTGTITLERNPRWWGEEPRLESIVWRIGEPQVLAKAYKAGELEVAPVVADNRAALRDADLRASVGSEWSQLTLNGGAGPLGDADVRRAVAKALDVDSIVATTSKRFGTRTVAMDSVAVLPGQVGHRPVERTRDLAGAQKLLAKAGWRRDGTGPVRRKGTALTLSLPVPDTMTGAIQRAEEIAEDLAEIGIRVKVTQVPGRTYFERVVIPLDFDLATFTWGVEPFQLSDARQLFTPIDGPRNFTGKASGALAKAFDAAVAQTDETQRATAIAKLDEVARAQSSIVPLAVLPSVMAVKPSLLNVGPTALADLDWTVAGFSKAQD